MVSDEGLEDISDVELVEEDFTGDQELDLAEKEDDVIASGRSQSDYTVMKEADIQQRQQIDITELSTLLSISRVEASCLLGYYHWNAGKVHDEWFADEERVRRTVGLLDKPIVQYSNSEEILCAICFDTYHHNEIASAACGHPFCSSCWSGYVSTAINDGPGCLMLRCPHPSCPAAVGQDMIDKLVSDVDKAKYYRYFLRSYIEDNKRAKWCPAPGCEHAVDFAAGSGGFDVLCLCSHSFCWNCLEEAHRPVDCDTVSKWILKNNAESENVNWMLTHSKPCPKCKRPIEKNSGCMHMTCTSSCKFEFCWLCLGAWKDHGRRTGGYYSCNSYLEAKDKGGYNESVRRREYAKNAIEKYTHYYERWLSNQTSRKKALVDLHRVKEEQIESLSDSQCMTKTQLEFITDALRQIIECRRVLKWTYAYGYYLPKNEHVKREFFEYMQGEAEYGLERLHQCAETDLSQFLDIDGPSKNFDEFHRKLVGLTSVTKVQFETLMRAVENDLADVKSYGAASSQTVSKEDGHRQGSRRAKRKRSDAAASIY